MPLHVLLFFYRFIKGFITRNSEENEANKKFLQFVRYHFLLRLSKALPNVILKHDKLWPAAPPAASQVSSIALQIQKAFLQI